MRRLLNGPTGPRGLPGSQSVSKNRRGFLCVTLKFISCSLYEITVVGIFFFFFCKSVFIAREFRQCATHAWATLSRVRMREQFKCVAAQYHR